VVDDEDGVLLDHAEEDEDAEHGEISSDDFIAINDISANGTVSGRANRMVTGWSPTRTARRG
jgi:hypothetical protein